VTDYQSKFGPTISLRSEKKIKQANKSCLFSFLFFSFEMNGKHYAQKSPTQVHLTMNENGKNAEFYKSYFEI
jgi:hypothetical protein